VRPRRPTRPPPLRRFSEVLCGADGFHLGRTRIEKIRMPDDCYSTKVAGQREIGTGTDAVRELIARIRARACEAEDGLAGSPTSRKRVRSVAAISVRISTWRSVVS